MTPYNVAIWYRRFGGLCCLNLLGYDAV